MIKQRINRGITRVDRQTASGLVLGWQVRIQRQGVIRRRFFNDAKYGGKKEAMAMARAYRDRMEADLRPPSPVKSRDGLLSTEEAASLGVYRVASRCRKDSGVYRYEYWQVLWSPRPGKRKCRRFSINKYGEKGAYERALSARERVARRGMETRFY